MEKSHILEDLEKVKMELSDAKQSFDVRERKLIFDLEASVKVLDFERKQHLEVIHEYLMYLHIIDLGSQGKGNFESQRST